MRPVRLAVRTSDFHSGNRGSIPLRATRAILADPPNDLRSVRLAVRTQDSHS